MDEQERWLVRGTYGGLAAVAAWVWQIFRAGSRERDELRRQIELLCHEFYVYKVHVAETYVAMERLDTLEERVLARFDKLEGKIDRSLQRPD